MNYVFYGITLCFLLSLYHSCTSLKNNVKYLESIIGFQNAKVKLFEREISKIYDKLGNQRDIFVEEISIIYDKLEK